MTNKQISAWMPALGASHKFVSLGLIICMVFAFVPDSVAAPATPIVDDSFPVYQMDLHLDPVKHTLEGTLSVDWTNATGSAQEEIYFRLYPNAPYYDEAETLVDDVRIDDEPVESVIADDATVLAVTPLKPIADGDTATISMHFTTLIPVDSDAGFGVFQFVSGSGVWNLADWYPILAGYEAETGWYLQEPTAFGDPTFAETSTYDIVLELPDDLTLVSTGETTHTQLGLAGTHKVYFDTGPAREFAMTLLPKSVETASAESDDVTVNVTLPSDATLPGLAQFMADTAAEAMEIYESWMGEYPSPEFDISVASLSGANGVSWSGLTWFSLDPIIADGKLTEEEKVGLAFVILHEVGHQWIADIIGSNNNDHGFMTEGLVNALAVLAAEQIYGVERADMYLRSWVAGPYSSLLNDGRDGVTDAPLTNDTNGVIRTLLIYGKAAVGFIAIREEIGEAAFLDGLAGYAEDFRFEISEPSDLFSAFESASGSDLDEVWSFWFNEKSTKSADLVDVLDSFTD